MGETENKSNDKSNVIAFQGVAGAYSDMACRAVHPDMATLPCGTFEDTFAAVSDGKAALAMIPIENSQPGRVADNHHLLPDSGLHIIGEHFQRVNHKLLGLKGTTIADLREVHSHVQALGQCRERPRGLGLKPVANADTAGAAKMIAGKGDKTLGALASSLAAEIYGLDILLEEAEDAGHNTTRFVILSREPAVPTPDTPTMMSFVFEVRNVPAALYKRMGGFATNGVNMTKLESYMVGGSFTATQFYADIEGHPEDPPVRRALEELEYFTNMLEILGVYPADADRG